MFSLIKQVFIVLINFSRSLACIVNASDCTKCISLNNQACMTRSTFIGLNPYVTIHFQLILIDVWKVVILVIIYLIEYVF